MSSYDCKLYNVNYEDLLSNDEHSPSHAMDMPYGSEILPRSSNVAYFNDKGGVQPYAPSQHTLHATVNVLDPSASARCFQDSSSGAYHDQKHSLQEKGTIYALPMAKSKCKIIVVAIIIGLVILIPAISIPVYLLVIKPITHKTASAAASQTVYPMGSDITGGDGSVITMEGGTTFIYHNSFGGTWYYDEKDPFNNGAKAQAWSPALNECFRYGVDQIRGWVVVLQSLLSCVSFDVALSVLI